MTMPIHINTLEHAKKLTAAGIPQQQAEAHALALGDTLSQSMVVVPGDLELLGTDILARIDVVKVELNARIDALEQRINANFRILYLISTTSLMLNIVVLVRLFSAHG